MPKPNKDETREDFLHRFMGSVEARRDYADEKQRFAVAASLWEHRNALEAANALGYNGERDGAEPFRGRHLQPGVVNYPEMKNPVTGAQGIAILVEKDVIDRMRPSAKGKPVLNWAHDMSGGSERWIAEGKAVGVMTDSFWNGDEGWEGFDAMIWHKEAKANARNGFRVSNAWKEDEIDWTPGAHNGVPYDGKLIAAHYTHIAIVPNPRYEGAVIYANAQGGLNAMLNLLGFGKKEAVTLDKDASIEVNGRKYPVLEVVNSMAAVEAAKAKVETTAKDGVLGDKDSIEIGGKKYSGLEVANALAAAEKAKTDEATRVAAAAAETKTPEAKPAHETPEFANAVAALVTAALEKAKGEGFFNAVEKIARARGAEGGEQPAPSGRISERERLARGKAAYGSKK